MTHTNAKQTHCAFSGQKGNWSGRNIAAMVVGFVLFWPVGLVLLYWNITGRDVRDFPAAVRGVWSKATRRGGDTGADHGNVVFNEYQETQYDRIREIKAEIEERARRFSAFRADARRRQDEEEFNRFMASAPVVDGGNG
ncbi:MAG: DUF2852 domain-containing protein [Pseudomonadota bacterium]